MATQLATEQDCSRW